MHNETQPLAKSHGWLAQLHLDYAYRDNRSYLAHKRHAGPLTMQKTLYPEGTALCHGIILHPPGGVAGGDNLALNVNLQAQTQVLLTTPGAGKWYHAHETPASQNIMFTLAEHAQLEWFPQENILFNGSQATMQTQVNLQRNARFATWDIFCLGRQASQEQWQQGHYRQHLQIRREGRLLWSDRSYLTPQHTVLSSKAGMCDYTVHASLLVAAGAVPVSMLEACRQVTATQGLAGVSALPELLTARYIGQSAETARHYFEQLWQVLRPWYAQRAVQRPRIWNT